LCEHARNLGLEGDLFFTIVGALAQHERLDYGMQHVRRQLGIGNDDRFRSRFHLGFRPTRQPGIQMTGKRVAVGLIERRRAAADIAAGTHRIHEITHG
jgi:hypothetical protein